MVLTRSQSLQFHRIRSTQKSDTVNNQLPPLNDKQSNQSINKKVIKFPEKLWNLVNCKEIESIGWSQDGKSIVIDSRELQYDLRTNSLGFKTENFASFTRQLNLYGFRKSNCSTNYLEYEHPYFTKEKANLKKLQRNKKIITNPESDEIESTIVPKIEIKCEPKENLISESSDHSETIDQLDNQNHGENVEKNVNTKYFGSVYNRFDYYGKRSDQNELEINSTNWDDQFSEDLPADAYFF